jgi:hypothetical protein
MRGALELSFHMLVIVQEEDAKDSFVFACRELSFLNVDRCGYYQTVSQYVTLTFFSTMPEAT